MTEEAIAISAADPADRHLIIANHRDAQLQLFCLSSEPEGRYDFAELFEPRFSAS